MTEDEHELIIPEETEDNPSNSILSRTRSLVDDLETVVKPGSSVKTKISSVKTPKNQEIFPPPKELTSAPAETERLFLYRKAVTLLEGTNFSWNGISKGFQGTNTELYKVEY